MYIREEFLLQDVEEYLTNSITSVIIGKSSIDDRCKVIKEKFSGTNARIITIDYDHDKEKIIIQNLEDGCTQKPNVCDFQKYLSKVLKDVDKNVLVDLTSLQHVVIILLMHYLSHSQKPARLFASYVKPQKYIKNILGQYSFSKQFYEPTGIPGLTRIAKEHEIVVPFLGFEGQRLNNIIESMSYDSIIPIIGFPSDDPIWKFEALRNCMNVVEQMSSNTEIRKCKAYSIFDAYRLLEDIKETYPDNNIVLLPLGTRAHTAACGLWVSNKKNVRIVYDYENELEKRSEGVGDITIYHLSNFI